MRGRTRMLGAVPLLVSLFALASPGVALGSSHLSAPTLIDPAFSPEAVSCPSSSFCAAVGSRGGADTYVTYSSHAWSEQTVRDPFGALESISCVSRRFCAAVDRSGHALTYTRRGWREPVDLGLGEYDRVSCASVHFCVAVSRSGGAVTYDGRSWGAVSMIAPGRELTDVSCPAARFCVAVDATGDALTYDGQAWGPPALVDAESRLRRVSCTSPSFCMAMGAPVAHERDTAPRNEITFDGDSWSAPTSLPASLPGAKDLSCASSTLCVAVGFNGYVAVYEDGSWSELWPVGTDGPSEAGCAHGSSFCVVLDLYGEALTYALGSTPPSAIASPATYGTAIAGGRLTETHATWTAVPSVYVYRWGDCDAMGNNCEYSYFDAPFYPLSGYDVGHTIRVEEYALGSEGTGGPAVSAPTCVVRSEAEASARPVCSDEALQHSPRYGRADESAQRGSSTTSGISRSVRR